MKHSNSQYMSQNLHKSTSYFRRGSTTTLQRTGLYLHTMKPNNPDIPTIHPFQARMSPAARALMEGEINSSARQVSPKKMKQKLKNNSNEIIVGLSGSKRLPECYFISNLDENDKFSETEITNFDIKNDIDKWEYKNIAEKKLSNDLFGTPGQQNDTNEASYKTMDQEGLNVDILNCAFKKKSSNKSYNVDRQGETKKEDKENLDLLLGRTNAKRSFVLNQECKHRTMNKEILNEIYYRKAWDGFKNSMTHQELMKAQQVTVNSIKYNGPNAATSDSEFLKDKILFDSRKEITDNIMLNYKNLTDHFGDKSSFPLDDNLIRGRLIESQSNYNQHEKKFSWHRNIDHEISNLKHGIDIQNNAIVKLRKKKNNFEKCLCYHTQQFKVIDGNQVDYEKEKRFKLATASFLVYGLLNNPKMIAPNPKMTAPDPKGPIVDTKKMGMGRTTILNWNENIHVANNINKGIDRLNTEKKTEKKISTEEEISRLMTKPNTQPNRQHTNSGDDIFPELTEKIHADLSKMGAVKEQIDKVKKNISEVAGEIDTISQIKQHKINQLSDTLYKTINNDFDYIQQNGIKDLQVILYRVTEEILIDKLPNSIGDEGRNFITNLAIAEANETNLSSALQIAEDQELKKMVKRKKKIEIEKIKSNQTQHDKDDQPFYKEDKDTDGGLPTQTPFKAVDDTTPNFRPHFSFNRTGNENLQNSASKRMGFKFDSVIEIAEERLKSIKPFRANIKTRNPSFNKFGKHFF